MLCAVHGGGKVALWLIGVMEISIGRLVGLCKTKGAWENLELSYEYVHITGALRAMLP